MTSSKFPRSVRVVEVGPRDGLQNEEKTIPTEAKIRFIELLVDAGLRDIEVTSFVNPRVVPQLADAETVMAGLQRRNGVRYSVLVPNLRGLERWLAVTEAMPAAEWGIALFTAASEAFNQRNVGSSIAESLENFLAVMTRVEAERPGEARPFVRGYVSMAFGGPQGEPTEPEVVRQVTESLFELGVDEVSLGDTVGAATPADVARALETLVPGVGVEKLAMHFHDTRGTALANVMTALEMGVTVFDSSSGGLGGCPFADGATGNVATEDLIYLLDGLGIETGVDLDAVVHASKSIQDYVGHALTSKEFQAHAATGY
ncbi:MAG TPA: hydroxymethylglutaryl-CoA lyase [Chloroflexota bacterium]|nr:hydroxymethylglutaryl-CoA lyase [Chloroflexota bacterium]